MSTPREALDFWFGAPPFAARAEWFRKSDAFDALIRERFGADVDAALAGTLPAAWAAEPLAEILLLDQFTRNVFRGTPSAFAGDARALAVAQRMVASGADNALHPVQRTFAYLPFEHAEDLAMQRESVRLFTVLAAEDSERAGVLDYAKRHHDVIARFGRFPHRNAILGRTNTADEAAFLQQPGSSF